ncbi:MAG: Rpn family recombination-promoting nuclease/putative transposase [Proteobacteria bacterium]|nr:Rpn family recombination-promoting nuclease/putative transposase [Pseudomonadota bacterium]MBU1386352.1 Rpn family recombination-promoting nuclease/putative transposase [Pseudomonadota bacterium]MBU1541362.1 Rpn family recombination-promoting nuclease/putative transposase [Pseudomonadota bacterium]MBU2482513.1 Rpn family recombination-promoting nuclease/putative transposase [Pseudomonadota bacterium]
MNDKLQNSHDSLFKETWSNKANARAFLENYLPKNVLSVVTLDSLEICKDTFIENDLKNYYSDMLYKVDFEGTPGYIYFLFEHKSYPDKLVHLQLLEYMLKIWRLDLKQHKTKKLSIIIPLLLYHGPQKWTAKESFSSMLKGPVDIMKDYIPDFRYVLYDLSRYSDNDIKGTITARVVMLIFKHIFKQDFAQKLPGIFTLLKDLSEKETGLQYFESLIKYIFSNVEDITPEQFQTIVSNTLSEDKGGMIMTLAEKLRDEGRQKGLEQGREKGLAQGIEQGLVEGLEFAVSIKFGDTDDCKTVITKIKSIKDINRLKALKGIIKSASTVPELIRFIEN